MSAITTTGRTRRGPLLQLDLASLRRLIGDRPWDHLEHDAGLAKSQIARIFERGGGVIRGDTLDDLCGALGIHESELLMNAVQPDALFQAIDDKRLGVSASSDSSLCIFCHTTPADEGYASCSSCRAHNLTLDREPGRPKKATPPAPKPVPKKEEVMSEPTTKKPFACDLCENSYNRSQDLGVHRFRAHGIHGPKTSAGRKPEPVPAPVQAVVEHVNALHVDGPDVPCDEACSWAKEGYALPSGPALPAHPDLRFELIHTRLRLIAAVCQAEDVSATTRALITGDLMRVRAIVDELEAERA